MSDSQMAQKRWMPNRMFDPASNPFAIQNLLEKQAPPFNAVRDERPQPAFGVDALLGGRMINAFEVDPRLLNAQEEAPTATSSAFVADPGDGGAGFAPEQAQAASGFVNDTPEQSNVPAHDERPLQGIADAPPTVATHASEVAEAAAGAAVNADDDKAVAEVAVHAAASLLPAGQDVHAPAESAAHMPDSEALQQMLEAARAEAYEQGLQAGVVQGREDERPLAHRAGYDEGHAAGLAQARAELQADREREQQKAAQAQSEKLGQLQSVIDGLLQLAGDPDALFEPMKQLAVHLAEQLVRGELSQSPQAISRLVDNALRELNASGDKAVVVHLNPDDLDAYRPMAAQFGDSLILRPDHLLERGSVRASLDGSVVEDMIQRRVAGLKQSLSQPAAPGWRSAGGKLSARLADGERGSRQVEDVTPVDAEHVSEAAPADGDA